MQLLPGSFLGHSPLELIRSEVGKPKNMQRPYVGVLASDSS